MNKIHRLYLWGIVFFVVAFLAGIFIGSTPVTMADIVHFFRHTKDGTSVRIFGYVRLPRTLASLFCGAALSVSGAVIQNVFANRLASPGIIGVNAGAGLAVTVCMTCGIYGGWHMSLSAFIGAFLSVMLIYAGARKWGASRSTVLLCGVAMNSLLGAFSDLIITFSPEIGVMRNDFRIGAFSAVTYEILLPAVLIIFVSVLILITLGNDLDILSFGEQQAKALGMRTDFMRTLFLLLSALLAGVAVSLAGLLSFVGLMVPHVIRRISGNRAVHLPALCALYGGAFVCICDTVARCVFLPYEIPVGMIMAFLGAPFFVYILIKGKGGHASD